MNELAYTDDLWMGIFGSCECPSIVSMICKGKIGKFVVNSFANVAMIYFMEEFTFICIYQLLNIQDFVFSHYICDITSVGQVKHQSYTSILYNLQLIQYLFWDHTSPQSYAIV